jgi:hypothetical protein
MAVITNMAVGNYFVADANPFKLGAPPAWFLQEMARFDADLVMFPSLKDPVYRLARRARQSGGVQPADAPGVQNHPDTIAMCNYKLVPVTTIVPGGRWGTHIFEKLAARDIWRLGGPNRVLTLIEHQEAEKKIAEQKAQDNELEARGADAYASYKYRTGQRVSMAHRGAAKTKQAKPLIFTPSAAQVRAARLTA